MFEDRRVQLTQSWKEEVFGYLDCALLMCEILGLSTYRSVRMECAGALKGQYERYNHKIENEDQIVGYNPN